MHSRVAYSANSWPMHASVESFRVDRDADRLRNLNPSL
jgi:hypothetical protein